MHSQRVRGVRVRRERDGRNNMIDPRPASVPGEKRKEISAENPRAVSLWVREARRAARAPGEWEVRRSKHLAEGISFCPRIIYFVLQHPVHVCWIPAAQQPDSGSCVFPSLAASRSGEGLGKRVDMVEIIPSLGSAKFGAGEDRLGLQLFLTTKTLSFFAPGISEAPRNTKGMTHRDVHGCNEAGFYAV